MLTGKDETFVFLENLKNSKSEKNCSSRKFASHLKTFLLIVVVVWLTSLTIIRELQLKELREEIDSIRSDLEDVRSGLPDQEFIEELRKFEKELDADASRLQSWRPSESIDLRNIKILDDDDDDSNYEDDEDDDSAADDENDDDDDTEDFALGPILEAKMQDKSQQMDDDERPTLRKVMKVFTSDLQDEGAYNRSKRDVIAETADGVPVLEESYVLSRAKNRTEVPENLKSLSDSNKAIPRMILGWDTTQQTYYTKRRHHKKYEHPLSTTPLPGAVFTRSSRVMVTNEDKSKAFKKVVRMRRPMTKSGPTSDDDAPTHERRSSDDAVNRMKRRRRPKMGPRRSMEINENPENLERINGLTMAHFSGDTSLYMIGKHEHYDGNGRLRHPHGVPYTAWSPAPWISTLGFDSQFTLRDGAVTISESGIYFVYAQVYYHDVHDTNGYSIFRNNGMEDEAILQCTTMTHSTTTIEKSNTCYTAGAFHLKAEDTISLKNHGSMRYSIMEPAKSFFGLIKLYTHNTKLK